MPGQPLLACSQHAALRRQQGANALTRLQAIKHPLQAPTHDDGMSPRTRRQTRRTQLGLHAATPQCATRTASHRIQRRIIGTRLVNQLGIRIVARISIEHAVTISENHQQISLDQVGHQRRQGVVVTETDFVSDHRIVLVDHRNDLELDQRAQGTTRIEVTLAVGQVVMSQENLRRVPAMLGKARLPGLHQPHLSDGGSRLQLMHRTGSCGPTKATHARRHRPGGHQHQLDTRLMQRNHLLNPDAHCRAIQTLAVSRQQSAADLHDPTLRTRHLAPHHLPTYAGERRDPAPPMRLFVVVFYRY
ncbi:hypothetical protein D3C84_457270 [compost metagenome]